MIRLTHHREGGVDFANIEGRFVQSDSPAIRSMLLQLVATGSGKLVLNLEGASYVDSYGLATLVIVWKAMWERDGRMVLSSVPRDVQALIELTCLQTLFEIFPSDRAAIAKLSGFHHEAVSDSGVRKFRVEESDSVADHSGAFVQTPPLAGVDQRQAVQDVVSR